MLNKIRENAEKVNFVIKVVVLLLISMIALNLMRISFSSFVAESNINVNATTAVYLFEEDFQNFDINLQGLVPRDEPYVYSFTVANYDTSKRSDVNIEYSVKLLSTTNLPLRFEVYRNENYNDVGATDIVSTDEIISDSGGAWYRSISFDTNYNLYFNSDTTDTYNIVVYYPKFHATNLEFQGTIENIQISIDSKQIVS